MKFRIRDPDPWDPLITDLPDPHHCLKPTISLNNSLLVYHRSLGKTGNLVYIIEFDLAKKYRDMRTHQHISYQENKNLTGTALCQHQHPPRALSRAGGTTWRASATSRLQVPFKHCFGIGMAGTATFCLSGTGTVPQHCLQVHTHTYFAVLLHTMAIKKSTLWTVSRIWQCCGSGMFIPNSAFFIPYPVSEFFPSRIHIKEFKYFNPKNVF